MPDVIQASRESAPGEDGWRASYNVVRNDGVQVIVRIRCSGTAKAVAEAHRNEAALNAMRDTGQRLAGELADSAQAGRGLVEIDVEFDTIDGNPRHSYTYERDRTAGSD